MSLTAVILLSLAVYLLLALGFLSFCKDLCGKDEDDSPEC